MYKKLTAVIPASCLEPIELALQKSNIPDVCVSYVKGYGEYRNFFKKDWMIKEVKIELFLESSKIEESSEAIRGICGSSGTSGGFLAVSPVDHLESLGQ